MTTIGGRLREERERLGQSQSAFGERCGVKKTSQINYEADRRMPDAAYLRAAEEVGVDVLYVLTGNRQVTAAAAHMRPHPGGAVSTRMPDDQALVLSAEEHALIDNYRHASEEGRRAVEAAAAALAKPEPGLKTAA